MTNVIELPTEEALWITDDARLVALRWDLLPYALVLDLDVAVQGSQGGLMRRAWFYVPH
jgi:hypothetical protein